MSLVEQIPDLEDLDTLRDSDLLRLPRKVDIVPTVRRYQADNASVLPKESFPDIPERYSIHVKTWGCGHNSSDGEYMAGLLHAHGFSIVDDPIAADLWVLNSCTVKGPSEQSFRNELTRAQELGKYVVVAGCVPQASPGQYSKYSIIGVQQIDRVVEVVEATLKGYSVRLLKEKRKGKDKEGGAPLSMPKIRRNRLIEIIPINTGCLNQCTYCKTKHARGELGSYPLEDIIARVKQVLAEGVVEIWLTSEDTGAYGRDLPQGREALPMLLAALPDLMPAGTWLRLGMTNPPYILEHVQAVADFLNHPRVYKFLHIPVQAGSDRVLDRMRREYTVADFCYVIDYIRRMVPNVTIATDVICGFPTETPSEFDETLRLLELYKFPVLNISQFYARPGTPAKRMKQIESSERKRRSRAATNVFMSYWPYRGREGNVYTVLATDTAHDGKHYIGHTPSYEQVLIPMRPEYLGKELRVRITEVGKFHMVGEVLESNYEKLILPFYEHLTAIAGAVIFATLYIAVRRCVSKAPS